MSNVSKTILGIVIAIIIIGIAYVYLVGPGCPEPDYTALDEMSTKILAIWNDEGFEYVPEVFAEDFVIHHSSLAEPLVGADALIDYIKNQNVAFPDFELTFDNMYISGDMLFVFWKCTGTNTGPLDELTPATGNSISIWGMAADKLVDGKIVEAWIVFNQYEMLSQLGMFYGGESEEAETM